MSEVDIKIRCRYFATLCRQSVIPNRVGADNQLNGKYLSKIQEFAEKADLDVPQELMEALALMGYSLEWSGFKGITEVKRIEVPPSNSKATTIIIPIDDQLPTKKIKASDKWGQDMRDAVLRGLIPSEDEY